MRLKAYIVGITEITNKMRSYGDRADKINAIIDVKAKAYEELVGANLRGERGEFFTPRNVQRMAVKMLALKVDEKILDPSCGTGGFLVIAMNEVIKKLATATGTSSHSTARTTHGAPPVGAPVSLGIQAALRDRISEVAGNWELLIR